MGGGGLGHQVLYGTCMYVRWMDGSLLSQLGSHDVGGVASISPVYHGECLNHIPQNATDLAWGKKEKENKVV